MNKQNIIDKIDFVISKRGNDKDIKNVLELIKEYVESQTGFDIKLIMQYIESQMPSKLGGVSIYIAKSLGFLKEEIKKEIKKEIKNENIRHSKTNI